MFAGIVEGTRSVTAFTPTSGGAVLRVELADLSTGVKLGDSIAINGVCLTVATQDTTSVTFDLMTETLTKTTLGLLTSGTKVNVERSLKVGDRIDGHFVQGHVFGLGRIMKRIATDKEFKLWIEAGEQSKYIAPVGSIAVHGVSLTVAEVKNSQFAVALIPTTLELTTLGQLQEGDSVNLEPDVIARQIVHFLENRPVASGR